MIWKYLVSQKFQWLEKSKPASTVLKIHHQNIQMFSSKLNLKNNKTLQQSHYRKLFGIILAFNLPLSVIKTYLPPILVSRDICEIQLIKSNKKFLKDRRCVLWPGYDNEKLKISQNRTIGTIWRECFNTKNLYKGSWRLLLAGSLHLMAAWLLLVFFLCLHDQLSSVNPITRTDN